MQKELLNQLGISVPESKPKLRNPAFISTLVVSFVGFAIYIAKGQHSLHSIISNAAFVLLILLIICLMGYSFYPCISDICKNYAKKKRLAALAKEHFKTLVDFVDRLESIASTSNSNSIPYILNDVTERNQHLSGLLNEFRIMLQAYRFGVKSLHCNGSNYLLLVKWLESLLIFYHNDIICNPIETIRNSNTQIDNRLKDDYKICRESYMKLINDYIELARLINKTYGENIVCDYFRKVKYL